MRLAIRFLVAMAVLITAFAGGATFGHAQAQLMTPMATPTVVSGGDIGFRVEGTKGDTPVGRLVVRINGRWVEAEYTGGSKRLALR